MTSSNTADDCPICLAPLRGSCQSLKCGHIYHEGCLQNALVVGHEHCAVCRASISSIRVASSRADVGHGYRAFVAPKPSTVEDALQEWKPPQRPRRPLPGGAYLPAADPRLSVLATVTRALPPLQICSDAGPNNYMFVLDISYSMGRLGDCSSTRCSRLGLALCYLAVFVSRTLRPRDRYRILAFDLSCTDLLGGWQEKGEDFSRLDAMDAWSAAIRAIRQGGSKLYTAVLAAVKMQEAAAKAEPRVGAAHVLIALTDGEAMDEGRFEAASAAVRSPDCPGGGFRALLLKIDDSAVPGASGRQLCDLGMTKASRYCLRRPAPTRPEHVIYQEAPLPAATNLSTPPGRISSAALGSAFYALSSATPTASRI